ncbi:MAG: transposase [Firmicutes bacterium]|nr:transposase [Bacillota bacterium]
MLEQSRIFTKEFKEQAVLLTKTSGKSVSQIAQDLGVYCKRKRRHSTIESITPENFENRRKVLNCVVEYFTTTA